MPDTPKPRTRTRVRTRRRTRVSQTPSLRLRRQHTSGDDNNSNTNRRNSAPAGRLSSGKLTNTNEGEKSGISNENPITISSSDEENNSNNDPPANSHQLNTPRNKQSNPFQSPKIPPRRTRRQAKAAAASATPKQPRIKEKVHVDTPRPIASTSKLSAPKPAPSKSIPPIDQPRSAASAISSHTSNIDNTEKDSHVMDIKQAPATPRSTTKRATPSSTAASNVTLTPGSKRGSTPLRSKLNSSRTRVKTPQTMPAKRTRTPASSQKRLSREVPRSAKPTTQKQTESSKNDDELDESEPNRQLFAGGSEDVDVGAEGTVFGDDSIDDDEFHDLASPAADKHNDSSLYESAQSDDEEDSSDENDSGDEKNDNTHHLANNKQESKTKAEEKSNVDNNKQDTADIIEIEDEDELEENGRDLNSTKKRKQADKSSDMSQSDSNDESSDNEEMRPVSEAQSSASVPEKLSVEEKEQFNKEDEESSEEEDDDESLSDYDEDDESDDSVDSEKEEMDDSQESEEESEEEDDDDSEEESEEEDTINKKKKNKNSKPREAQLLSNQGTGAADIGLIDINRKIEYDEGQADTIVDGDEEEDYDDDSDDNDEDDVQKEQSLKRTAKAENETSDTIIHHGFGGDEGWSDLLQATKKVKPLSSKTPRDSKQQAKKKSKRSRDKMEISKNFQGLIRVSNFPHGFFDDEMRGFFSQFGNIGNCIVARNPKTHQPLGYAYIEFLSPEIAEIAADAMHGYMMLHTVLDVKAVDHPGPHFWKKTEFNIKPIARFDEPSFMLGKYQEHRNRQMKKMKRRETEERMKKMREGIRNKEKEMREKYGIEYRYKMDSLLPDCSGARVTLGQ
eukprot:gb/GECH01010836.1/.p1 GENE.gb/GECH01010836.1/~~gb/GECH01010836.1/.p1  ORF type:complete len:847 (+),score=255.12 gb/GECH01010836.1/:1-2541(+)